MGLGNSYQKQFHILYHEKTYYILTHKREKQIKGPICFKKQTQLK